MRNNLGFEHAIGARLEAHNTNTDVVNQVEQKITELLAQKKELEIEQGEGLKYRGTYVKEALGALPEEELAQVCADVINKIRQETQLFDEYEEADLTDYIFRQFDDEYKPQHIQSVLWGQELGTTVAGRFDNDKKEIRIAAPVPSRVDMLVSLATSGDFPVSVRTLNHETTHGYQFPDIIRKIALVINGERTILDLVRTVHQNSELAEAHARRFGDGSVHESREQSAHAIKEYPGYRARDRQLLYAIGTMEQLKALGVSSKDVGELVCMQGKWDEQKSEYPNLEAVVSKRAREYFQYANRPEYVAKDFDYVLDLELLIQKHHLEIAISHLKAQIIAQNAVQEFLPPELKQLIKSGAA